MTDDELLDDLLETTTYVGAVRSWRGDPATEESEDEPGGVEKYSEDQPRDDQGQWTSGGEGSQRSLAEASVDWSELSSEDKAFYTQVGQWVLAEGGEAGDMRNVKTEAGKKFFDAVKTLPDHQGTIYRGLSLTPKEYEEVARTGVWTMKWNSSSSMEEQVAKDFAGLAAVERPARVIVLLEMEVSRGRDISPYVPEERQDEKEVVMLAGTKFDRVGKPKFESGRTRPRDADGNLVGGGSEFKFARIKLREQP